MSSEPAPAQRLRRRSDSGAPRRIRWPELRRLARSDYAEACRVLGVSHDAPWSQVEASYRKLALVHHPDLPSGSSDAMVAINAALETIRNTRENNPSPDGPAPTMKTQRRDVTNIAVQPTKGTPNG